MILRSDIENVFGKTNVVAWADLDNQRDSSHVADRVAAAIVYAETRFTELTSLTTEPGTSKDVKARIAGIWLYESRGIVEEKSPVEHHKKFVMQWVQERAHGRHSLATAPFGL